MTDGFTVKPLKFALIYIFFSGCVSGTGNDWYMYKDTPITRQQKAQDILECEVQAANQVPVNNEVSSTPIYTTPTYTTPINCYTGYGGFTTCTGGDVMGGQTYGGQVYTRDANQSLRERVYEQCMANRGYNRTATPIPLCRSEQIPDGYVTSNSLILPPRDGACAINGSNGSGTVLLMPEDQLN